MAEGGIKHIHESSGEMAISGAAASVMKHQRRKNGKWHQRMAAAYQAASSGMYVVT